ncbi:alpha-mannosidase [Vibrio sp. HN007]|uniref:glycoside hydrolase family 38 N-terminal domain-containing protein n=1 Tax=Vibrio iocasae TaxID=3098914 RepID=UPI0035D5076B
MTKVHVVPHTHWDREWYFTQQDSDVLATYNFTKVIETLENVKEYSCYHLDGQSSIVEDYLKVLPHMRDRMAKLVTEKKLFIGPWYTQTDTYNVAAESIIRNLKYGMHIAEELGHSMMVGYLPDTFGHNAQMPTIFKGMGIDNIVFWRGLDYDSQVQKSNFFWQSAGGDSIYAYNLVHGYGAAKNIVPDDAHLDKKIFPMVEKIKQLSGLDEVLIPSGGDQVNIDPHLPETLAVASKRSPAEDVYTISSMESFVDHMRRNSDKFETYIGEFKQPRYTRIHKTIGSVRYDIKKLNFEIEQFLLKRLEVVIAIAKNQGINVQTELVDIAWKKILECHAHDSMGGCNSDATNADIMHRLKQADEICQGLFNLVTKELADSYDDNSVLMFNGQIKPYSGISKIVVFAKSLDVAIKDNGVALPTEIVSYEELDGGKVIEVTKDGEKEVPVPPYYRIELNVTVSDLPAMGYKVLEVSESDDSVRSLQDSTLPVIHNEELQVALEEGELYLHHKPSGRHITQLIRFEEQADDGDSYDFSPLEGDVVIYSQKLEWTATRHGETEQVLSIRAELDLPVDLDERQQNKASGKASFDIDLTLVKGQSQLLVDVRTINQIKDHRVRIILNSDLMTDTSIATQPFALMERPVSPEIAGWRDKFRECPVDIETTDGAVAIKDADKAMIVQGRGLKEFQVLKGMSNDQIALTLFKSTGVLGKDDLLWRPGRASGINNTVVHTPDAQLQSEMSFNFSIAFADNAEHQTVRQLEQEYLNQPFSYQKQSLNSFENRLERFQVSFDKREAPQQVSLFEINQPVELSSIGHSFYKRSAVIVRLFNPTDEAITFDASALAHLPEVEVVNYREAPVESGNPFEIRPNNSIDLRLTIRAD